MLTDLENMLGLLNRKAAISDDKDAKPLKATKAAIRFENVSFSYDKQRPILNNLSFEVTGSKVAIVGASGAGKAL